MHRQATKCNLLHGFLNFIGIYITKWNMVISFLLSHSKLSTKDTQRERLETNGSNPTCSVLSHLTARYHTHKMKLKPSIHRCLVDAFVAHSSGFQ